MQGFYALQKGCQTENEETHNVDTVCLTRDQLRFLLQVLERDFPQRPLDVYAQVNTEAQRLGLTVSVYCGLSSKEAYKILDKAGVERRKVS